MKIDFSFFVELGDGKKVSRESLTQKPNPTHYLIAPNPIEVLNKKDPKKWKPVDGAIMVGASAMCQILELA